jgi:LuxR family maltose regulon positive regulatory protein
MTQLILDKISVPAELPRLSRPRLLNRLQHSLASCNLSIINGRAGTGKTILGADFARTCGRRVAWYKVDASDSDPLIFLQYLIASINRVRPGFCHAWVAELPARVVEDGIPQLAESFVYELLREANEPLLIVIDDLHLVYDADWVVPFFARLAPLLPAEAHLMLLGRILPPAPLWRMRSKQTLSVIDETTLAFTPEESKRLFDSYGIAESQMADALQKSHGRAALLDGIANSMVVEEKSSGSLPLPLQVFA